MNDRIRQICVYTGLPFWIVTHVSDDTITSNLHMFHVRGERRVPEHVMHPAYNKIEL